MILYFDFLILSNFWNGLLMIRMFSQYLATNCTRLYYIDGCTTRCEAHLYLKNRTCFSSLSWQRTTSTSSLSSTSLARRSECAILLDCDKVRCHMFSSAVGKLISKSKPKLESVLSEIFREQSSANVMRYLERHASKCGFARETCT